MRKVWKIAQREYLAAVKTKGFLIGLVMAPLLMGGSLIAIVTLKDHVDVTDKRVAVLDHTGVLTGALIQAARERNEREVTNATTRKKAKPAYGFEAVEPQPERLEDQRLLLSERVRRGELHGFLEIGAGVIRPSQQTNAARITYHAKNPALDDLRQWLAGPINEQLRQVRLAEAGIDRARIPDLFDRRPIEGMGLLARDTATGGIQQAQRRSEAEAVGVPAGVMMLMWMMVLMGAMPLLNAVMEEKNQRIAEIMLGAARPFELMLGKVLAGLGVSLTGSVIYLAVAVFALGNLGLAGYLPYHILPWFFVYLVLNIFMLGAVFAAAGSLCTDAKDVQNMTLPAMLPSLIPMFIWLPVVQQPLSTFATATSLFPPFTPILMLLRQCTPETIPAWQPWVGLAGVIATATLCVWVGGRVFRLGMLWQGRPPKLAQLVRLAVRG